jgi:hypothetical protein
MRKASLLQVQGAFALSNAAKYSDCTISKDPIIVPVFRGEKTALRPPEPGPPGCTLSTRLHQVEGKKGMPPHADRSITEHTCPITEETTRRDHWG